MSVKSNSIRGNSPAQQAGNMDWACQSLASSTQQKVFQTILRNQMQPAADKAVGQEINSLRQGIKGLTGASGTGQNVDAIGGLGDLATSALIRLNSFSSRTANLGNAYMAAFHSGQGSGMSARSQGGDMDAPEGVYRRPNAKSGELGSLAACFEAGDSGPSAIGYDNNGGTSYGTFQISSRAGTMRRFLDFLGDRAPDLAERLTSAGPANTGGRNGGMPREWRRIAAEEPERFAGLQQEFIHETHYLPALQEIHERTGVNIEEHSRSLREVLWSTAVQHGPKGAANIFCKAIGSGRGAHEGDALPAERLIETVYSARAKQFGSSTSEVRNAVRRRFQEEKSMALAMLPDSPEPPRA